MLNKDKVRIGIAPIAWTEDDMPEMGADNSFKQTISEIAWTGYAGTEIGCQYPRDPKVLNTEFGRRGLSAITAWISTYLNVDPYWKNERAFVDHCRFLKAIGTDLVNVSDQSYSVQHCWNTPFADKPVLDDAGFETLAKGLDQLGKVAADLGMRIVYHHHMTTTVQTAAEIDRLMALTDPRYVNLLFDAGHLTFSGDDAVAVLDKHFDRIKHVHLKNVRGAVVKRVREQRLSFLRSIPEGVFTIPGDPEGIVNFPAIFDILDKRGYEGWLVVEAEQDPEKANPLEVAFQARAYVREQTGL